MYVAILCEYGTVSGGENSILAMLEHLPEFDFTVLAPPAGRFARRLSDLGIHHVDFSLPAGGPAGTRQETLGRLVDVTGAITPDVVHGNSLSTGRLTGALSRLLPIPTSAHLRDILRLSRAAIADLNGNNRLFAVSQATRDFHVAQGLDASRTHVLFNGIDGNAFGPVPRTGWLHKELMLPATARLIATIGQISLRKGQDVLLDAAVRTAESLPEAHWLIIGERYSQKQESIEFDAKLHERVAGAGLGRRVHWLGYRDDVARLLPEVDLLVHPARQEPLGRVLLEAAACGVPIIATDVGGTAEILGQDAAILVPPNDPATLSAALTSLLRDDAQRAEIGTVARETILQRFPIKERAGELAHHWKQLLDKQQ